MCPNLNLDAETLMNKNPQATPKELLLGCDFHGDVNQLYINLLMSWKRIFNFLIFSSHLCQRQ